MINEKINNLKQELAILNAINKSGKTVKELIYDKNLLITELSSMISSVITVGTPREKAIPRKKRKLTWQFKKRVVEAYKRNDKLSVIKANFNICDAQIYQFLRQFDVNPSRL